MQTRIFAPLRTTDTAIQTTPLVRRGFTGSGRPAAPMVMNGLAPTGGAVSTTQDLARLTIALLNRTAPGISALDPIAATDDPASRIGVLWKVTQRDDGHVITQKNGKTAGLHLLPCPRPRASARRHRARRRRSRSR
jgi:CubicO group peptidase (beta-lactamase class C family)